MNSEESEIVTQIANEFKSSTELSLIKINVREIDSSVNKDKYLEMKECICCKTLLGKQAEKKNYCHFCYAAVCSNCSLLPIVHPENKKEERACNLCYLKYLNIAVLDVSEEFVKIKLKAEIAEREKDIQIRKKLAEDIQRAKESLEEDKKRSSLRLSLTEEEIKNKEYQAKVQEEKNKKLKLYIEDLIRQQKIDPNEYKTIEPDFVAPRVSSSDCIKCILF